ncbi:MAG: 2-amino-4-hydroxy-6-hydroxymethyldihydropteridine diphosphokinase [Desulfobacteraceae bacterium]|nr:2-amino-4-hydroxy-6-hydroxymethyldihydropteridine diphosphokinase [Pseudomonadota bacterium]MCG2755117.1 2-amino-4-hydroxy-6-hydroxymethyldihydropteridine diphosphokinase [Desulfobacteraceae bacterium]
MNQGHIAYISAGSNIGNRLENCKNSLTSLAESKISIIRSRSSFYITEPVDYINQDWFVNLVVKIETKLDPFRLLDKLKSIQSNAGRDHDAVRFSPRILDLDIIMYDDFVINSPELIIPHPRMHKRRFVLKPICDIDPHIVHPVLKKDMQYLLDRLDDGQMVRLLKGDL